MRYCLLHEFTVDAIIELTKEGRGSGIRLFLLFAVGWGGGSLPHSLSLDGG